MAQLDENNKFISQTNLGWTFSFEANGKYPMIANRIFATKADAEAYIDDTTLNATAIPGLILRVIEDDEANNGAYLVVKDGETALKLIKIATGDLKISGKMIDVIQYAGDATHEAGFYNKADGTEEEGTWIPSEDAQPIKNDQVTEEGKYLCLKLNETDNEVYIKSSDLIDLTNYYTKDEVDEKINTVNQHLDIVDVSISTITNELSEFVDIVENHFIEIDSSIENINNNLESINDVLDTLSDDVDKINGHLDNVDGSIDNLQSKNIEIDSSIENISSRLSESLKSAKIAAEVAVDNSTLIRLTTTDNTGIDSSTIVKVAGSDYIIVDSSTTNNILLSTKIGEVSTATEDVSGLATANDVKEYVDTKIAGIGMIFDSSTPSYISTSVSVNNGQITSSVGVITASLVDASNGSIGLAMAQDVYKELVDVEEVIASTQIQIANKVGLDSSFNLVWSEESGITEENIKDAVENILLNINSSISDINSSISNIDSSISNIDSSIININSSISDINSSISDINSSIFNINNSSISFSSDTSYIHLSASDNTLALNSNIITLVDASNGSTGLAIAQDVYTELVMAEKVAAAALTAMAITLGINSSFNVNWSEDSGIPLGTNYKTAIELYRNYSAGLGLSLNDSNHMFSLNPATSSSIGGVKIIDSSISGITLDNDGSIGIVGPSVKEIIAFLEED